MKKNPIYVTRPDLPPFDEFLPLLEEIWASRILSNLGPFHNRLEEALSRHLGVRNVSLFANGTIALIAALRALNISGEVITTPYSFVATSHALLWNGITPVFADVDPSTLNLDHTKIESAVTDRTSAILAVHCYGTPCDVDAIQKIADKHDLKVIYDAAHAFGVRCHCGSVLEHGDLSVLSFHATKVFNTLEGGAVVSPSKDKKVTLDYLKNFGFSDEVTVDMTGINGKMNEIQAAYGLLQLKHLPEALRRRAHAARLYQDAIAEIPGIRTLPQSTQKEANNAYFPIFVDECFPLSRDELYETLKSEEIYGRRYFYPLIPEFPMYHHLASSSLDKLQTAYSASRRVICLPMYGTISPTEVRRVTDLLRMLAK